MLTACRRSSSGFLYRRQRRVDHTDPSPLCSGLHLLPRTSTRTACINRSSNCDLFCQSAIKASSPAVSSPRTSTTGLPCSINKLRGRSLSLPGGFRFVLVSRSTCTDVPPGNLGFTGDSTPVSSLSRSAVVGSGTSRVHGSIQTQTFATVASLSWEAEASMSVSVLFREPLRRVWGCCGAFREVAPAWYNFIRT